LPEETIVRAEAEEPLSTDAAEALQNLISQIN